MNTEQPVKNVSLPFVKPQQPNATSASHGRLEIIQRIPPAGRNHFVAWLGEFVGTFLFLFFAFSATQIANYAADKPSTSTNGNRNAHDTVLAAPSTANLLYIALAFGFSLVVNAWVFFRITGGLFNPAVTLGLCLIGAITWTRGALVFTAQIIGSIAAAAVVSGLFPGPMNVTTSLNPNTSIVRGLFIEMILTAELIFTIFMLAAEKSKATFLAPIGIGLALFIAQLSGVYFTGGSLNPARSFGPAVINGSFESYHWIYWIGPWLGSLVAVLFYKLVKGLEYETVNPGQDDDGKVKEHFKNDEPLQEAMPPNSIHGLAHSHASPAGGGGQQNTMAQATLERKPVAATKRKEHSAV